MMRDVAPRTLSAENRFLMYSMMRDVVQSGTATRAKALGRSDIAGKTGTTNDYRDAWFNGYNESLVAIAWVGHDDFTPLGRKETGGRAALPAWIAFMREALEGVPESLPVQPPGIVMSDDEYFDTTVTPDYTPDVISADDTARPEDTLF